MKDEVSPIEILKATPKNNCGECGHNTCISFATAIVRQTDNYKKCPYLKLTDELKNKLELVSKRKDKKREPGINALTDLENKIKDLDFKIVSKNLGLIFEQEKNMLKINYLNTTVTLTKENNSIKLIKDTGEDIDIYDKILIYNYIFFSGTTGLANEWIGMENLPNSISKVKALEKGAVKPFVDYFTGNLNLLKEKIKKFPHKLLKNDCVADICFVIYIFPMLPVRINFWDALKDEGMEAEAKFLFDKNVMSYLDLESIVFASEKLCEKLTEEF